MKNPEFSSELDQRKSKKIQSTCFRISVFFIIHHYELPQDQISKVFFKRENLFLMTQYQYRVEYISHEENLLQVLVSFS